MSTLSKIICKQGTTPTLEAVVDREVIQDATVYLAVRMHERTITKCSTDDDVTVEPYMNIHNQQIGTKITATFTQEETLMMIPGNAHVEVGWVFEDGEAGKTKIGKILITESLIKGVMKYVNDAS